MIPPEKIKILKTPMRSVMGRYGRVIQEHLYKQDPTRFRKMEADGTIEEWLMMREQIATQHILNQMKVIFNALQDEQITAGRDPMNIYLREKLFNTAQKEAELSVLSKMAPTGLSLLQQAF